jgi:glutathione synthase/RimK-type ligase-like ATP-grasp enzyme
MKIALVTTLPGLIENKRIEEEVKKLNHEFQLINLKEFSFSVFGDEMKVGGLEGPRPDIVIVRGIFNSIKAISVVVGRLRKLGVKIFDNNFLEHRYSIDKVTDLLKLASAGIPIPDMIYVRDYAKYYDAAEKLGYPLVIKSTRMGKGVGVNKIDSKDELTRLIDDLSNQGINMIYVVLLWGMIYILCKESPQKASSEQIFPSVGKSRFIILIRLEKN